MNTFFPRMILFSNQPLKVDIGEGMQNPFFLEFVLQFKSEYTLPVK